MYVTLFQDVPENGVRNRVFAESSIMFILQMQVQDVEDIFDSEFQMQLLYLRVQRKLKHSSSTFSQDIQEGDLPKCDRFYSLAASYITLIYGAFFMFHSPY
jgi:hypothetical protein